MRFNPPSFEELEVAEIVSADYGLEGQWKPLVGERDQNFRLTSSQGDRYVVKIAGPDEKPGITEFQVEALLFLERTSPHIPVPRIVPTQSGANLSQITNAKEVNHALRVVSYIDGIPYGDGEFPDAEHLQKIGAFMAGMVNALESFEHPAARHFMPWNLSNGVAVSRDLWADAAPDIRSLATPLLDRLREEVLPAINACPSQVIHNDGHTGNLLRADASSQDVVGLIDFGDMVYAPIINELAVTATTFQRNTLDDLGIVENLLIGFHAVHPLSDEEVALLWDAIILRLIITVLLSDIKLLLDPYQATAGDDRSEALNMLEKIIHLDHNSQVNRLRAACGYNRER